MTASCIGDLKTYVTLNELTEALLYLQKMFKNKNYTLFLPLFNCLQMKIYFLLTIAFKTVFYKIYRNH